VTRAYCETSQASHPASSMATNGQVVMTMKLTSRNVGKAALGG
jgi:hypothetical protein